MTQPEAPALHAGPSIAAVVFSESVPRPLACSAEGGVLEDPAADCRPIGSIYLVAGVLKLKQPRTEDPPVGRGSASRQVTRTLHVAADELAARNGLTRIQR